MEEKNKLHILMLITSFSPFPMGGSEKQAFNLAKELKNIGYKITIFSFGKKEFLSEENISGINIYRMSFSFSAINFLKKKRTKPVIKIEFENNKSENFKITGKKSFFSFIGYFLFLIECLRTVKRKKINPDIIYVPIMEWTAFIAAVMGNILKKKVLIKDSTMNGITNLLRYPFGAAIQKYIIQKCFFVAMTDVIKKNYIASGINEIKIEKIPNGIELNQYTINASDKINKFLFVGNLYQQPAKGVDILLKAWNIVIQKIPRATLFIIGDGNTEEYKVFSNNLGLSNNVQFLGKQKNISEWMANSYAFILPSRREGMSNALLEAMASGMPCIATNISGNQDLINNGENGFLVPPENEHSLANAVINFYNNPEMAKQMGNNAQKTIEKNFTMKIVTQKYVQYFYRILSVEI